MRGVGALLAGVAVVTGCDNVPGLSTAPAPSGSAGAERRCRITMGGDADAGVPLASEVGQQIKVTRGTKCVVLDSAAALTRVRITDGPYVNAVAWAQSGVVVIEPASK